MKSDTSKVRFAEATKLLDYGFSKFEFVKYSNKGDIAQNISVEKGIKGNINVIFSQDSGTLIPKGQSSNIITTINLPDKIQAPIEEGQVLGNVTYSFEEETLRKC